MKDKGLFHQALPALAPEPLHFPVSDGRFLPANPLQANAILSMRNGLESHFRKVPNVVMGGNMFMYYDPQDPAKWIEPDIIVVLDHDLGGREPYRFWVERKSPDFALDVIAPESGIRDQEDRKKLYAELRIKEYFLFQPDMEREAPRLVGYRLWGEEYIELNHDPSAGPDGALRSAMLGLSLRPDGERVRLRNLATGKDYPWYSEKDDLISAITEKVAAAEETARRMAQERRAAEARARRAAEESRTAEARAAAVEATAGNAAEERRAAEARARRAAQERRAADERARRAAQERRAADERAAAAEARARRVARERRAAEKRAAALEARTAKLEAFAASVGIHLPEHT